MNYSSFSYRLTNGVEKHYTSDLSRFIIYFPYRNFSKIYSSLSSYNTDFLSLDYKNRIAVVANIDLEKLERIQKEIEFKFLPTYFESGNEILFHPNEFIAHNPHSLFNENSPFSDEAEITKLSSDYSLIKLSNLNENFIQYLVRNDNFSSNFAEPNFIDFIDNDLSPNKSIAEILSFPSTFKYPLKSKGTEMSFELIPDEYLIELNNIPAEDASDYLDSEGYKVELFDHNNSIVVVSRKIPVDNEGISFSKNSVLEQLSNYSRLIYPLESDVIKISFPVLKSNDTRYLVKPCEAIIRVSPNFATSTFEKLESILNANESNGYNRISDFAFLVFFLKPNNLFTCLNSLVEEDFVLSAEPNFITFKPENEDNNLRSFNQIDQRQWGLININLNKSWTLESGFEKVVVVIIDTGIDLDSEFIKNNILSQGDEDWNFTNPVNKSPLEKVRSHGTSISGIICSNPTTTTNYSGVCPHCKIMPIKSWETTFTSSTLYTILKYINDFKSRNPDFDFIVNMSFNVSYSEIIENEINVGSQKGIYYVASAGNNAQLNVPHYPSDLENVISVASIWPDYEFSREFSNCGNKVKICAPGGLNDNSTDQKNILILKTNNSFTFSSGTSYSAPHVSGSLALILSYLKRNGISLSKDVIVNALLINAKNIDSQNPDLIGFLGSGALDLFSTLTFLESHY